MAISTSIFTTDTFPVPSEWIFEKFLNLTERLTGQSVSIKSIFNDKDSNPSMVIYLHDNGKYKFKDFSSGKQGDSVDLIQELYQLPTRQDAFRKAHDFYINNISESYEALPTIKTEYSVINIEERPWNILDQKYWSEHHIGSKELEHHCIRPLKSYTFKMKKGAFETERVFEKNHCYGFFRKDGTLFKIYNAKDTKRKFIKVKNYIQGHDQLTFTSDWLMILSSLKDLIAFKQLNILGIECIAPDSESTILTQKQMEYYKKRYKFISTLFDNDSAGKKAMKQYQKIHGIPFIEFEIEKDLAECIKQHGIKNSKLFLKPFLITLRNARKI